MLVIAYYSFQFHTFNLVRGQHLTFNFCLLFKVCLMIGAGGAGLAEQPPESGCRIQPDLQASEGQNKPEVAEGYWLEIIS